MSELEKCFPGIKASRSSSVGEGNGEGRNLGREGRHNRSLDTQRSMKEVSPASPPAVPSPSPSPTCVMEVEGPSKMSET